MRTKCVSLSSLLRRLAAVFFLALVAAAPAWADKYASFVLDMDSDKVLHARNADAPRHPASLTKVMTLYMVFEGLKSGELMLSDRLPVSAHAASQSPSKLGLKPGSTIALEDAIEALVTKSANDVAVVVAERIGGTETRFAALMTAKARQLGLLNTHFTNASGLHDENQVSTARDLAKLGEAILVNHSEYYDYFSTREFSWAKATFKNHNKLLGEVRGVDGIKTGYTRASGFNLLASADRDGHRVIAVMLGGATSKSRNRHVTELLEAAYKEIAANEDGETSPDLRARIAFNEIDNLSTADLNDAQLKTIASESTDEGAALEQGSSGQ